MRNPKHVSALSIACAMAVAAPQIAHAQTVDFGDDSSTWARDGECDDPRFAGDGMTSTTLLPQDTGRDATDCRNAFERGLIRVRSDAETSTVSGAAADAAVRDTSYIDFGDDDGDFARDGECDDRRFTGEGMTQTPLLEADVLHDASDCRDAYRAGRIDLVTS